MTRNSRWKYIKKIFSKALELEGEDRLRFISAACSKDETLRLEVESLLSAHESSGALDRDMDAVRFSAIHAAKTERLKGRRIGSYRLMREIGHGGMGSVFLAERADGQFEQQAALKLLHSPFATEHELGRFRTERQILATLDHEHIARLLDGGITDDGQPYYVMEYVEGLPLNEYCDKHHLIIKERLHLFLDVISAVEYAHRKLIVHRDLKPSNIMVTDSGKVKLLDFGIAKVLESGGIKGSDSYLTKPGLLPLTPSYASPEQIRGEVATTSSDIYQLGVVLYELLTGSRPYIVDGKTPAQTERIICEDTVQAPGSRISLIDSNEKIEAEPVKPICKQRGTTRSNLKKMLDGEPGQIILKAMRKEPDRRYDSVNKFGDDIRRYLSGKPVSALPDSRLYRLKKFIGRNPIESVAALIVTLLLIGYLVTITWHSQQTREALHHAQLEADKSARVVEFMLGMFESGDPRESAGDLVTARELLERGLHEADLLVSQPAVQASMYNVIGKVYIALGRFNEAARILEKAVETERNFIGSNSSDLPRYLNDLATAHTRLGSFELAFSLHDEALQMLISKHGVKHPAVADAKLAMGGWIPVTNAFKAAELRLQALEIRREVYGENHLLTADAYVKVGQIMRSIAEPEESLEMFKKAREIRINELGPSHPEVAQSMIFYADILRLYKIDQEEAEGLYRDALTILEKTEGGWHPSILHGLTGLGSLLSEMGRHQETLDAYERSYEIRKKIYGENHPSIAEGLGHIATGYIKKGSYREAEIYSRKSLKLWEELIGRDHITVSGALLNLGEVLTHLHEFDEAEALIERAINIQRSRFGEDSGALAVGALARLYKERKEYEKARKHYREAIELFELGGAGDHYDLIEIKNELAELNITAGGE